MEFLVNINIMVRLIHFLLIKRTNWGLGIGDWGLANPQSPIPNPQSPFVITRIFDFSITLYKF